MAQYLIEEALMERLEAVEAAEVEKAARSAHLQAVQEHAQRVLAERRKRA